MGIYMNLLSNSKDVEEYKIWLSNKPYCYLKCLLGNLKRDGLKEKPKYLNLELRIELVTKELKSR